MQDLHDKLEALDGNVKALIRKLNEALHINNQLKNENNKLKLEIGKFDLESGDEAKEVNDSKYSSGISEEKYHKIKSELNACIVEIDEYIDLIEK